MPPVIKNQKAYRRLFHDTADVSPFFAAEIFAGHYKTLRCLLIGQGMGWTSYLPEAVIRRTMRAGLQLYRQEWAFSQYLRDFAAYRRRAQAYFRATLGKSVITKRDVAKYFSTAQEFSAWYSKMEFFYTDEVYDRIRQTDQVQLRKHVRALGPLKLQSRRFLNRMIFRGGFLSRLLNRLSRQFDIPLPTLRLYRLEEILRLFDGQRVADRVTSARLSTFVIEGTGRSVRYFAGSAAERRAKHLLANDRQSALVTGTVANKGKVIGRVIIIPPNYTSDISILHRAIATMKFGDILVAESTTPELMPACKKAAAIVTNQGGMLSHAAIVSRELHIPCIVGTGDATRRLKNNDRVEVDANRGLVRKIYQ